MRTKKGFKLRDVCGDYIIVAEGMENIDFSRIISMNESAAYLWRNVQENGDFSEEMLVKLLLDEYDTDEDTARADVKHLVGSWKQAGIIE